MGFFLLFYPDLRSGESEEEERVRGMSGEEVSQFPHRQSFQACSTSFGLPLCPSVCFQTPVFFPSL